MSEKNPWLLAAVSFGSGLLFALGLALSGMTQPAKVIGFLDVAGGRWDPSLAFVMMAALAVTGGAWLLFLKKRTAPILTETFHLPTRKDLDARLLGGAAIFGLGWGLGGFCPGPGIVSLATGAAPVVAFVAAMLVGIRVVATIEAQQQRLRERAADEALREG